MAIYLHHSVHIKFKTETPEEVKEEFYQRYQPLAAECGGKGAGIKFFVVDWNEDRRKRFDLVEVVLFTDNDALQKFRAHPAHKTLADDLSHVADIWTVGDIYVELPM